MIRIEHPMQTNSKTTPNNRSLKLFFNPVLIISHFWRYRQLIRQLAWREILGRYKGSFLGMGWSLIQPIMMLCVYTFVFSIIFNARWGISPNEGKALFGLTLFLGLICYGIFADVVNTSPQIILGNVNYVKKVVFPLEILPLVRLISCIVNAFFSLVVLFLGLLIVTQTIHLTSILIPLMLLPIAFISLGFGFFLSALGVFVRDVGPTVNILTTMVLFLSPIFYPIQAVPERFRFVFKLNPMAIYIEDVRKVVLWGQSPDWAWYFSGLLLSMIVCWVGFIWFMKAKKAFADVI
jgi:homopolymeric O-antigen transport system permease protein